MIRLLIKIVSLISAFCFAYSLMIVIYGALIINAPVLALTYSAISLVWFILLVVTGRAYARCNN